MRRRGGGIWTERFFGWFRWRGRCVLRVDRLRRLRMRWLQWRLAAFFIYILFIAVLLFVFVRVAGAID